MLQIYLAGPDVFRPDALDWADLSRRLVDSFGHRALIPLDNHETTAEGIFEANIALISQADVIMANINPFRGLEPDSGTAFEIGCAVALGKRVIAYLSDTRSQIEKLAAHHPGILMDTQRPTDSDGNAIENFGLPVNLMLAVPSQIVKGTLEDALRAL